MWMLFIPQKSEQDAYIQTNLEVQQRKIMSSVCWDWKGVVFFEVLPRNRTIKISEEYCRQLGSLYSSPTPVVVFCQDNAKSNLHTSGWLLGVGWDVLLHPEYLPNLVSSDFHLICFLSPPASSVFYKQGIVLWKGNCVWGKKHKCLMLSKRPLSKKKCNNAP